MDAIASALRQIGQSKRRQKNDDPFASVEHAYRVEQMRERWEAGLDIWTGRPLTPYERMIDQEDEEEKTEEVDIFRFAD